MLKIDDNKIFQANRRICLETFELKKNENMCPFQRKRFLLVLHILVSKINIYNYCELLIN